MITNVLPPFYGSQCSSSSIFMVHSVVLDAGRRPLCPIHYTEKFRNSENKKIFQKFISSTL